jgi:Tol biopolymer transport system component
VSHTSGFAAGGKGTKVRGGIGAGTIASVLIPPAWATLVVNKGVAVSQRRRAVSVLATITCVTAGLAVAMPASGATEVWGDSTVAVSDPSIIGELSDRWLSSGSSLSRSGRYVAFESDISLVPTDTNSVRDVYRKDMKNDTLVLASQVEGGIDDPGSGPSYGASISADGTKVAFRSEANDLVSTDTDTVEDIFVRNIATGHTRHVSVGHGATEPDARSLTSAISANGRYVVFSSGADNLLPGPVTQRVGLNVYVRDLREHSTALASVNRKGLPATEWSYSGAISDDGRWVVFESHATNLLPSRDVNGNMLDTFVRDMTKNHVRLLGRLPNGDQPEEGSSTPAIASGGRYGAFASASREFVAGDHDDVDVFRANLATRHIRRISVDVFRDEIRSNSTYPSLSEDGHVIAFLSVQKNPDDWPPLPRRDVWVRDVARGTTGRASVDNEGDPTRKECYGASIAGNGRAVGFTVEDGTLAADPITVHALNIYLRLNLR